MSKLEAITVCVNYDDFLEITLPLNARHFDNIFVITSTTDKRTVEVCHEVYKAYKNITVMGTEIFTYNGAKFNKGGAINFGLQNSVFKDWIGTIDSDTVLHDTFREDFLKEATDVECSYASRRYDVPTFKEWEEIKANPELLKTKRLYRGIGYGNNFFWNYKSKRFQELFRLNNGWAYPYRCPTVAESDWLFRNQWSDWIYDPPLNDDPNQHEIIHNDRAANPYGLKQLPFHCIHLGETGRNESSRITPKFE